MYNAYASIAIKNAEELSAAAIRKALVDAFPGKDVTLESVHVLQDKDDAPKEVPILLPVPAKEPAPEPVEDPAPVPAPAVEPVEAATPAEVTKEALVELLVETRNVGGTQLVREVFAKYGGGAKKLLDVKPEYYEELYKGAKKLMGEVAKSA